jgi:hypothetical protein
MRTAIIVVGGLVLVGLFALVGWRFGGGAEGIVTAAKIFIAVWLVAALINMWFGVARAGYSVAEELPIFVLIFAVPAALATVVWWKSS